MTHAVPSAASSPVRLRFWQSALVTSTRSRAFVLALAVATLVHAADGGVDAQGQQDGLTFFKNYFVTGDYVAAGVGLRGKGVGGFATDGIWIGDDPATPAIETGVPAGADIVAAFLYWQVVTTTGADTGSLGVKFRPAGSPVAYALQADNPATPVNDPEPFGKALAFSGTSPCYNPGGSTGSSDAVTWTYRADVQRFFETDFSGDSAGNPNYGKLIVNGAHEITLPDSGPNGLNSPMALGASLVVVYRLSSLPLASIVLYDDGVTLSNTQRTLNQTIAGFYQATATPNARISYLVGSGQADKSDYVVVPGGSTYPDVFSGSDDAQWDTLTFGAGVAPNASQVETTVSVNVSGGNGRDCLTPAAMVFRTDVQDTDGDGLLDVWETVGAGGPSELSDPDGQALPALGAMGADPNVKDLFIEIGYMGVGAPVAYGGVLKPQHTHLPMHAALKKVGDAFRDAPVPGGIRVHFDVGNGYPAGDPSQPENDAEAYIIRGANARGGEAIDETQTACQPGAGAPVWECQFSGHPGTVGWKSGFRFLRDQVVAVNGAPPAADFDEEVCGTTVDGTTYACERRFDTNRLQSFHYALFAHAIGLPKSELACLDGDGNPVAAGPDDRCAAGQTANPDFHTPRTNTGIGDFPGGDVMVTLGGFPDVDGLPVGTPFMQASTLMHELGHNFERRHGGDAFEPNCKPTYLSVMNYLYQLRGLLTDDGTPHLGFSGVEGAAVNETALDGLVTYPPYRLGWYAPLEGSYREGNAQPAARHCNGSDLLPTDLPMVRVDARYANDPIDWNADNVPGFDSPQDVNFSGAADEVLGGSVDWPNVLLNQVAGRRNVGGLFIHPATGALLVGPLSADVGKGDLGKGDLGKGDLGKGDLGKGDLGKGDLGKGDLGKGDLGKGDLGKGDLGGGDLFLNDPSNPAGELDAETAGALARTPPNNFQACVIDGVTCGSTTDPLHRVRVSFASSNTGGNPVSYRVYRVDGDSLGNGQPWTLVADVAASAFDSTSLGIRDYSAIDAAELTDGAEYTYFAIAVHGPEDESDLSNLRTITAINDPPQANDDAYVVNEDASLSVAAPGVLGNDGDSDSGPVSLTASLVTGPASAQSFSLNADGSFTYAPIADFNGADSFVYSVGADTATVAITVTPVNDPPSAGSDGYSTAEDTTLTVPTAQGVLAGDQDVDGDTLTAVLASGPSQALAFTLNADGSFTYTPAPNFTGTDAFTYRASDGAATSAPATVTITVTAVNDTPTISAIANRTIDWNTSTGPIPFTIGDADGLAGLSVSGSSGNEALVPNANIVFAGTGDSRTVTVTPATAQFGSAIITVVVSDGAASAQTSFLLTVNRVQYTFVAVANLPPKKTKSGSTSSMKWQYQDGSTVLDTSSLQHTISVCRVEAGGCTLVDTMTNTDAGSSSFRYSNGVWTFNLQTRDRNGVRYAVGDYQVTIVPGSQAYQSGGPYPLQVTR